MRLRDISADNYCIEKLSCICNECAIEFDSLVPSNYELVCFEDSSGSRYFLPVYGECGYLYLLEKLFHRPIPQVTAQITAEFNKRLSSITARTVSLLQKNRCPSCKGENITVLGREVMHNYPVRWLGIDIDSLPDE